MANSVSVLSLPGDGIGPEVMGQARRVMDWFQNRGRARFEVIEGLLGGAAIDALGTPMPEETMKHAMAVDVVFLGAVGGPKWDTLPFDKRPERGLLGIRKGLGLFANLRPAVVFEALADASTLKKELVAGLDIMIVRELTGGIYFGEPRGVKTNPDGSRTGFNTLVYSTEEIRRIARVGFELARKRGGKVCSIDKSNVLESTVLWREEVEHVHKTEFPEIELSHLLVDNAAMQMVRNPKQFDVIVTTNMFGDIISDLASMLTGSLGMLPSASLGAPGPDGKRKALYEPIHGTAPDIAGQGKANPLATILSFAMMLRYSLNMGADADLLENAVKRVLDQGIRTGDIKGPGTTEVVSTTQMGDAVLKALDALAS